MQEDKGINIAPIKGRVRKYLKFKGISQRVFFEKLKIATSSFKGKPAESEFGGEILSKIALEYKELSPRWLLTGEGDMEEYNSNPKQQSNSILGNNNIVASGQAKLTAISPSNEKPYTYSDTEFIRTLLTQIQEKDRQIILLTELLEKSQGSIHALAEALK